METTEKLNFLTTLLPLVGIMFIIAMGVIVLMQQFRKNLYRQRLAQEELITIHQQELLKSSILVQEEERKRIATDIHDELGATLSIARMHLMTMEKQTNKDQAEDTVALQNIRSLIETSITSVRRISHELMPQNLQMFGLSDTLQRIGTMVNSSDNIHVQINCDEEINQLSWDLKLGLYRICLELINNTIKHAKAKHICLDIHYKEHKLSFLYTDDGIGLSENFQKFGLGQKSIEARAMSIGGALKVGNNEQGGFYAQLMIADLKTVE
ncbi:MAG: histidine kinase [Bacteroidota bacterium]